MNICLNETSQQTATLNTGGVGYDATWSIIAGAANIVATGNEFVVDVIFTTLGAVTVQVEISAEAGGCAIITETTTFNVVQCICQDADGNLDPDGTDCNNGTAGTCCSGNCVQTPTVTITST